MRRRPLRPARADAIAALEDLYAQLPGVECKGLCYDSCTHIDASELERQRIREMGVELPGHMSYGQLKSLIAAGKTPRCPALGPMNTCSVYSVRPMICRAFGVVADPNDPRDAMICEHGCYPDGTIDPPQLFRALREIEILSVAVTGVRRMRTV